MPTDLLRALWILLPAAAANAAPVFSNQIPYFKHWNTPLDGGRRYHGRQIFGPHKTWRGLLTGTIVAIAVLAIQRWAAGHFNWSALEKLNYQLPLVIAGALVGFGALGGDAIESFAKRWRGIPAGERWLPFDQLDYIIGFIILTWPFIATSPKVYGWVVVEGFVAHVTASYIGWLIGFKPKPI